MLGFGNVLIEAIKLSQELHRVPYQPTTTSIHLSNTYLIMGQQQSNIVNHDKSNTANSNSDFTTYPVHKDTIIFILVPIGVTMVLLCCCLPYLKQSKKAWNNVRRLGRRPQPAIEPQVPTPPAASVYPKEGLPLYERYAHSVA